MCHSRPLLIYIRLFNTAYCKYGDTKFANDCIRIPLVSEATTLPTEPQPLPWLTYFTWSDCTWDPRVCWGYCWLQARWTRSAKFRFWDASLDGLPDRWLSGIWPNFLDCDRAKETAEMLDHCLFISRSWVRILSMIFSTSLQGLVLGEPRTYSK